MIMASHSSPFEMREVTDPVEVAKAKAMRAEFDRNSQWLENHFSEVYLPQNRGKFICISGEEAYIADTVQEAIAQGRAAHPQESGWFTRYIPREKIARIYAI